MGTVPKTSNYQRSIFTLLLAFAFASPKVMAFDCYSDCNDYAQFTYPCPTISNPGRRCDGRDPVRYGVCEAGKEAACQVLQPVEGAIIDKIATMVADDPHVKDEARGWTRATCLTTGAGIITAISEGYSAPVCAALNVAAAGCVAFIAASGGVITGAVCNQLCTDHHLSDCQ